MRIQHGVWIYMLIQPTFCTVKHEFIIIRIAYIGPFRMYKQLNGLTWSFIWSIGSIYLHILIAGIAFRQSMRLKRSQDIRSSSWCSICWVVTCRYLLNMSNIHSNSCQKKKRRDICWLCAAYAKWSPEYWVCPTYI